jgi:magnesium transporter
MPQRNSKTRAHRVDLAPETRISIHEQPAKAVKITQLEYEEAWVQEKECTTIEECFPLKDPPTITWINVAAVPQGDIVQELGAYFELHPLVMAGILNTDQRPKVEDFDDYLYIVLKMLHSKNDSEDIGIEQASIILASHFVLSFQDSRAGNVFDPIRARIWHGEEPIRKRGADYLAYALVDAIVDSYFAILEKFEDKIGDLEEELVTNPNKETLQTLHTWQREITSLRKLTWPLREVSYDLRTQESPLISKSTSKFFKDVSDRTAQVIDTIETFHDTTSDMFNTYMSDISNRINEVMKVLTIISTVFIPISFIAGVEGMNLRDMPERNWPWAYPVIWVIMLTVVGVMLLFFKRKRWL